MTLSNKRIEVVFDALLQCPTQERVERGKLLCAGDTELLQEVQSLVAAAKQAEGFLSIGPEGVAWQQLAEFDPAALHGQRFGAYEIVSELDRGGMGVVFLAERADGHYQSQVAIKVARRGLGSDAVAQRFNTERQFLAQLRHPGIAQLLDGGTSDCGHPYLVMENITGHTIDNYCASRHLSIEDILLLMGQVCEAVHYAHQNLIVHCDLKPANIMITAQGKPKLLDFGIAMLLQASSTSEYTGVSSPASTQLPLTPEFAAPEQIYGSPVTTAVDVYSLGVILYKLLSGQLPYRIDGMAPDRLAHAIAISEIALPSTMALANGRKKLSGDLDRLVMKAMHKNPAERYSSVQMLSEDIDRFLAGHPLLASRPTACYRSKKFIARHCWSVSLGTTAFVILLLGSIVSTWQWQRAREQQQETQYQLEKVYELTSLMVFELPANIADLPGSTVLRERLIRKGVAYLDELSATNPKSPQLQRELATAYYELARLQGNPMSMNLGDTNLALSNFEKALAIQENMLDLYPSNNGLKIELAQTYTFLGGLQAVSFSNLDAAHKYTERCLALMTPDVRDGESPVVRRLIACYTLAAHWRNVSGEYEKARAHLRNAEQLYATLGISHPYVNSQVGHRLQARVHEEWAEIESNAGNRVAALQHEQVRLSITLDKLQQSSLADRHIGAAYHALGARLVGVDRLSAARDAYDQALAYWQNWQNNYPSDVSATQALAIIHAELADVYNRVAIAVPLPDASTHAREQVCKHLVQSLVNLARLPAAQTEFPKRYTWSPSPKQIQAQQQAWCPAA